MKLEGKVFTNAVLRLAPLLVSDPSGVKASARLSHIKVPEAMRELIWSYAEEIAYPGISVRPGLPERREVRFRRKLGMRDE